MKVTERIKSWFKKNKKKIVITGSIILTMVGINVAYVVYNKNKFSFSDWLNEASTNDLKIAYEKLRINDYLKTGNKSSVMKQIDSELQSRSAKEWFKKHPPNKDPLFRWSDANRWDKD